VNNTNVKRCVGCGAPFRRPTGTARIDNQRWESRRYCGASCGFAHGNKHAFNGSVPQEEAASKNAQIGSQALLVSSIKYGLAHDSDLGMGYEPFMARARELGLVAKNHGEPQFMGSLGSPVFASGDSA